MIITRSTVGVDQAELSPAAAFLEYTQGPLSLAEACSRAGIRFLTFSSDLVFDGSQRAGRA